MVIVVLFMLGYILFLWQKYQLFVVMVGVILRFQLLDCDWIFLDRMYFMLCVKCVLWMLILQFNMFRSVSMVFYVGDVFGWMMVLCFVLVVIVLNVVMLLCIIGWLSGNFFVFSVMSIRNYLVVIGQFLLYFCCLRIYVM